ncbi:MAG: TorF family putative porin [Pseudolabrys sp.]
MPALAADMAVKGAPPPPPPSPYKLDVAVGGVFMSDYLFRGISQSDRGPSGGAYFEPDLTTPIGTFYAGLAGYAISWPSGPGYGFTDPDAEVDIYGGWRNSWGPLSLDLGIIEYYYPSEQFNGFTSSSDFYELYGKVGYDFGNGLFRHCGFPVPAEGLGHHHHDFGRTGLLGYRR